MRLIDADALIHSLEKKHERWKELSVIEDEAIDYAHKYAIAMIRKAPTYCVEMLMEQLEGLYGKALALHIENM